MQILASELSQYLERDLSPLYTIVGDEPFQHHQARTLLCAAAIKQGYTEREVVDITGNFDWAAFETQLNALTLFSRKRLIHCRLRESKLSKSASDFLCNLILRIPRDVILIFSIESWDSRLPKSSWFMALKTQGWMILARPLSLQATQQFCKQQLQRQGLEASPEVITYLVERTAGNLSATHQVIEKLKLYYLDQKAKLTLQDIQAFSSGDNHFTLYDLVDKALEGSALKVLEIFTQIKNEGIEPILVLWALTREIRSLIPFGAVKQVDATYLWKHRSGMINAFLQRTSLSMLYRILTEAKKIDETLKRYEQEAAWRGLLALYLQIALASRSLDE